jgi:hypothetical protein
MTQDEIIKMGIKAELCDEFGDINWEYGYLKEIVAFAKLVAEHEREACAKVCESLFDMDDDSCNEAEQCANAIRARGQA